jgi:hypothetical protein
MGGSISVLLLLGILPGLRIFSQAISVQVIAFLSIFGNGNPWAGVLIIGCICALVGGLFDSYSFYQRYKFRKL